MHEEWTKAQTARVSAAEIERDMVRKIAALDRQAAQLARVQAVVEEAKARAEQASADRDLEAHALRRETDLSVRVIASYQKKLTGLGAVEDVRALVSKPGLVAMVEFIDKNPGARKVLDMMKADSAMALHIQQGADALASVSNGLQATWKSRQSDAAERYLASLDEPAEAPARDSGLEFGM